jgi:hypothetical protein
MNQLLSDDLWATLKKLAKRRSVKRAAVAYVSTDDYLKFGAGDILVTDASDGAIKGGQTDARVLERAFKRGAAIYSCPGLHSKIMLLDGTAVIGSANVSASSATSMIEAAWVTDQPSAVGMVSSLVRDLAAQAQPINKPFLQRIKQIKVKRTGPPSRRGAKQGRIKTKGKHRTWIIGVHEMSRDFPDEQEAIDRGMAIAEENVTNSTSELSWVRWNGNSRFRSEAKEGDCVIQIWRGEKSKQPEAVYRHAPIIRRQDEDRCTRFYVEQFSDEDETAITWGRFKKLVRRVGLPGSIGPGSARPVSDDHSQALSSLWGD